MKRKTKCKVCGARFFPTIYTAKGHGGISSITTGVLKYDACDCPECGKQIILGERFTKDGDEE